MKTRGEFCAEAARRLGWTVVDPSRERLQSSLILASLADLHLESAIHRLPAVFEDSIVPESKLPFAVWRIRYYSQSSYYSHACSGASCCAICTQVAGFGQRWDSVDEVLVLVPSLLHAGAHLCAESCRLGPECCPLTGRGRENTAERIDPRIELLTNLSEAAWRRTRMLVRDRCSSHIFVDFLASDVLETRCICDAAESVGSCMRMDELNSDLLHVPRLYGCTHCGVVHRCAPVFRCTLANPQAPCFVTGYMPYSPELSEDLLKQFGHEASMKWAARIRDAHMSAQGNHLCDGKCATTQLRYAVIFATPDNAAEPYNYHVCLEQSCHFHAAAWAALKKTRDSQRWVKLFREQIGKAERPKDVFFGLDLWYCERSGKIHYCAGRDCLRETDDGRLVCRVSRMDYGPCLRDVKTLAIANIAKNPSSRESQNRIREDQQFEHRKRIEAWHHRKPETTLPALMGEISELLDISLLPPNNARANMQLQRLRATAIFQRLMMLALAPERFIAAISMMLNLVSEAKKKFSRDLLDLCGAESIDAHETRVQRILKKVPVVLLIRPRDRQRIAADTAELVSRLWAAAVHLRPPTSRLSPVDVWLGAIRIFSRGLVVQNHAAVPETTIIPASDFWKMLSIEETETFIGAQLGARMPDQRVAVHYITNVARDFIGVGRCGVEHFDLATTHVENHNFSHIL